MKPFNKLTTRQKEHLINDQLIWQGYTAQNKIFTVRKRLPTTATPDQLEIRDLAKKHNGRVLSIIADIKKKHRITLKEAYQHFCKACGVNNIWERRPYRLRTRD